MAQLLLDAVRNFMWVNGWCGDLIMGRNGKHKNKKWKPSKQAIGTYYFFLPFIPPFPLTTRIQNIYTMKDPDKGSYASSIEIAESLTQASDKAPKHELHRGLKARHIQMIALGGTIGMLSK